MTCRKIVDATEAKSLLAAVVLRENPIWLLHPRPRDPERLKRRFLRTDRPGGFLPKEPRHKSLSKSMPGQGIHMRNQRF